MKSRIFKNQIHITPRLMVSGNKLWVVMKRALNDHSEPRCYATIEKGQKIYELPCPRRNIKGLFISL